MTAAEVAKALGKARRYGTSWKAQCPCHDDRIPSLSLTDGAGGRVLAHCHAGCPQEAVIAALKQRGFLDRVTAEQRELVRENPETGWRTIVPVPDDVKGSWPPHRLGTPSRRWLYRNAQGQRLFVVARWDFRDADGKPDKEIRPCTFCQGPNGRREWRWQAPSEPRPLYGLDQLAQRPEAPVIVTEGEKSADAACKLFSDHVAVTSQGGAGAAGKSDWAPLRDRTVTIWRDHDQQGQHYAADVARLAYEAVAASVRLVEVPAAFPEKWDVADPLPDGWDADGLRRLLGAAIEAAREPEREGAAHERDAPPDGEPTAGIAQNGSRKSGMTVRCIADIEARPVRWLWPGRIARGKVTLIAGHPGLGKSQLALKIAATVTGGAHWPVNRTRAEFGSVLILSAEDDVADTIRPRLEAAGADLARCHVIEAVKDRDRDGQERVRGFSLADDVSRLATEIEARAGVALVIIDPFSAYLGATDSHRNAEVRGVLAPLSEVAAQLSVAIIGIHHLRKSLDGDAILKVSGSLAFVAAARAAYVVTKDQTDERRRLFLPLKNNLGNDTTGYAFRIEPVTLDGGISTCGIVWEPEAVTIGADEALKPEQDSQAPSKLEGAVAFLCDILEDGPVAVTQLRSEAEAAGIAWATVRRAADELGVVREKVGFNDGWRWRLADAIPPGREACL